MKGRRILTDYEIADRIPIWIGLSEFYLDTELQEADFIRIAQMIRRSPYSLDEVKTIDKDEIFPVLVWNLLGVAGEWAGFDEDWLVASITGNIRKRNLMRRLMTKAQYLLFGRMNKDHYKQLERMYGQTSH